MRSHTGEKTPHLNIRIKARQRALIELAAQAADRTVSDFVRDAALREAQNALLEQTTIRLDEEEWKRFTEALDTPPHASPRLRDLMSRKPVWKRRAPGT